jgi:phage terminase large subunit
VSLIVHDYSGPSDRVRDFVARGAAADLFRDEGPEVAIVGSAGTGKTVAALMKLHADSSRVPGMQSLIVRQTHASLTASTLVAFEQFVIRDELESGKVKWFGGSASKPAGYRYPNKSMIMVGGMDNPGKVLSMSLDRVLVDEANQVSVTAYETLLTRLRGSAPTYKQIVTACNPDHPEHWLKQRADDQANAMRMYTSKHQDNPYLCARSGRWTEAGKHYLGFLGSLTGVRKLRYLDGVWAAAEGLVFDPWRDDDNRVPWFPVPRNWPLFLSIDFGYSNPFVCQWWRVDPDGRMFLTREIHQTQTLVEDHAKRIKQILVENRDTEGWPVAVVCDHDAEDRATFTRHSGLSTEAAHKAVERGVQLTHARIRPAGDGRPRLFVFADCVVGRDLAGEAQKRPRGFLGEVNGYVWAVERGPDGIPREVPLKKHDHSMDAARYAVAYLDWNEPTRKHNPAAQRQQSTSASSTWSRPVAR